ncbi:ABC transporter permease [Streptomyces sp. NPDC053741]|uniref:Inner-membrane translocator n=1 Tax=Streptomyces pratensis (strain ATCC 33331 / IAF-45CD) TaxID=591167 RepID=A0A8D3WF02_STRFA|nr:MULTISPECIES: ABC transporter permease [Streptomyces]MBD2833527.1 ABC transporter permease [Streptomyces pratensis]MYT51183.1 ABC transporter permease [Streptomyces sp. SID7815]RAS30431.1 nucleoside ABC transporter membrane protein [Streptomyces avidinii]TPN06301.1 ABC transporter permease [Mesorhizobium sp. B2-3-3]SNX78154.1 nucleoside ABC transporter membrane protein [Streptomyces microflavus]
MSTEVSAARVAPKKGGGRRRLSLPVVLLIIAGALALVSLVRLISGANDVTSVGQVSGALELAVPIGLAGLGGLWAERAGVVNIGLEGMMILGTWFGAWAGFQWGPWVGVLFGIIGGALGGLLHAVITVTFGVNHIVSGVAINILAVGVTRYLSNFTFADAPGGSSKQSPRLEEIDKITVPGLSDWMQDLQQHHWFFVSDLAGIIGGLVTGLSLLTVVALLLIPVTWFVLWRTAFGLRLRSCGESPVAAETLGVNVYKYKYIAVTISGGLAGLGGAFLAIVATSIYQEGQTGGRGYIGLAAMIFGNWMPGGMALGAGLFGFTDSLKLRGGAENVHAMLLLLAILLVIVVFWQLYRKKYLTALISAAISALLFTWYFLTDQVPSQFVDAAPYVTTLLVLALSAQRLRMPKADGVPYRKGEGK